MKKTRKILKKRDSLVKNVFIERFSWTFILGVMILFSFFSLNFTVADLAFDNTKIFDPGVGKYGKITIKDNFGTVDLAELELKTNTDICYGECSAEKEIIMHQKGKLVDDVRFIDNKTGKETTINEYRVYFWNGIEWAAYKYNEFNPGTYKVLLVGNLRPGQKVDWQIKSQGLWITEWTIWDDYLGNQLISYYDLNTDGTDGVNAITLTGNGTFAGDDGILGGAINFTGAQYHNTSKDNNLMRFHLNFTASFWVNMTAGVGGYVFAIMRQDSGGTDDYTTRCYSHTDQDIECCVYTDTAEYCQRTTDELSADIWQHIAVVYNGSNLSIYRNGTEVDLTFATDDFSARWGSGYHLVLGDIGIAHNNKYEGRVDEFAYWNRSLNSSEILDLWNSSNGLEYAGAPIVTLNNPPDNHYNTSNIITFNCSATDGTQVDNISLILNGVVNHTVTGSSASISLEKILTLPFGQHTWTCNATDNDGTVDTETTRTISVGFIENSVTYNSTTFEILSEQFITNISYNGTEYSAISSRLYYNGTAYLGTGTGTDVEYIVTRNLDIPTSTSLAKINKTFIWEHSLTNSTGGIVKYNSSEYIQTINPIVFVECNETYASPIAVNYTIYNEQNLELITTTMDATFDYWLGDGSTNKTTTINSVVNSTFQFCINSNETYTVDATINLYNTSNYQERTFSLNNQQYNNKTTDKRLYLLPINNGTNVIIQVRDAGLVPLQGYYVSIERYYPENGTYREIITEETDEYGQFVARLIENTIKYRFTFRDSDNVVRKTTGDMTIACRASICVLPFIIEDTEDDIERFLNLTDYDWALNFNNDTNIFTFSWTDTSGQSATMRLLVTRYLWNGTTIVCNTTSTSASASLTCNVGNSSASYQAQAFRRLSGQDERRIGQLSAKIGAEHETFGTEGLIWSFFLLFTMIAIGYWYPPIGIVIYLFGIVLLMTTNIIYVNPAILFAQLAIGIAFIWAFKRRTPG
jgi:hypothetical protein